MMGMLGLPMLERTPVPPIEAVSAHSIMK